jgi:hypothetical protein
LDVLEEKGVPLVVVESESQFHWAGHLPTAKEVLQCLKM